MDCPQKWTVPMVIIGKWFKHKLGRPKDSKCSVLEVSLQFQKVDRPWSKWSQIFLTGRSHNSKMDGPKVAKLEMQNKNFWMQILTGKWHFSAPKTALLANKILKIFILCLYSLGFLLLPVNWLNSDDGERWRFNFGGIGLEEYGWLGWRRINGARILHHL